MEEKWCLRMLLSIVAWLQVRVSAVKSPFLRRSASRLERLGTRRHAAAMLSRMTMKDVMRPVIAPTPSLLTGKDEIPRAFAPVYAARPDMTLADVRSLVERTGLSGVPVVESMVLVGWIDCERRHSFPGKFQVSYLIDQDPPQIGLDRPAREVEDYLYEDLPVCVVDAAWTLCGVVTWESYRVARYRTLLRFLEGDYTRKPEPERSREAKEAL